MLPAKIVMIRRWRALRKKIATTFTNGTDQASKHFLYQCRLAGDAPGNRARPALGRTISKL